MRNPASCARHESSMSSATSNSSSNPPRCSNTSAHTPQLPELANGRKPWAVRRRVRVGAFCHLFLSGSFRRSTARRPPTTSPRRAARASSLSQPGSTTSSASQKAKKSPRPASAPRLRACAAPLRPDASTTRQLGRVADHRSPISTVPSREPLSAITTSQAAAVVLAGDRLELTTRACRTRYARGRQRNDARLWPGLLAAGGDRRLRRFRDVVDPEQRSELVQPVGRCVGAEEGLLRSAAELGAEARVAGEET